ncbi:MAG: PAS domain S-box protein [Candidatus Eisenbacteria sp.]|nr:PAS domain S-box protein [Candidatus Eisenbacteria bacterium]
MARGKDSKKRTLQEQISTQHHRVLARCFGASADQVLDGELAEKYAALIAGVAELPRERLMALRFLPDISVSASGATSETARARPRERASGGEEVVLFRRMAEASGSGFGVANLKGEISYVNPALSRMLGEPSPSHAVGRSVYDYYPEEDCERLLREAIPAAIEHRQWSGELTLRTIQGRLVPTIQNIFIVHGEHDDTPYLANLIVDISDRKRAEEALRTSEERFRSVFDNATIGIYRTTPDGRILMANRALLQMLGCESFRELAERNLEKDGYEPRYSRKAFKDRMARDGQILAEEAVWLRQDGMILHVRESVHLARDAAGDILYYEGTTEDITDWKLASEALRTSEENFRALAENANDGILITCGEDRHTVFANRRATEISGYTKEELVSVGMRELVAPEELDKLAERIRRRIAGETVPSHHETKIMHTNGQRVPVEITSARTSWEGRVANIVILRDITQRKAAEAALRESEEKYRSLVENIRDVLHSIDRTGKVTYISPTVEQVGGYRPEEIIGKSIDALIHPDDLERGRKNIAAIMAGKPPEPHEYRLRLKSGEYRWMRISSLPVVVDGEIIGLHGVMSDIHDLKTTQIALQESERQYVGILEQASDGIGIAQDAVLRFVNPALARMLGYRVDELLGAQFADLIEVPESGEALARYEKDMAAGTVPSHQRLCVRCKDGTRKWIEIAGWRLVQFHGRSAAVGIAREVDGPDERDEERDSR